MGVEDGLRYLRASTVWAAEVNRLCQVLWSEDINQECDATKGECYKAV